MVDQQKMPWRTGRHGSSRLAEMKAFLSSRRYNTRVSVTQTLRPNAKGLSKSFLISRRMLNRLLPNELFERAPLRAARGGFSCAVCRSISALSKRCRLACQVVEVV